MTTRHVIAVEDWKDVEARTRAAGGRVLHVHDRAVALVELPDEVAVESVGAASVEEADLTSVDRAVVGALRAVMERPPEEQGPSPSGPLGGWDAPGSPLAGEHEEI